MTPERKEMIRALWELHGGAWIDALATIPERGFWPFFDALVIDDAALNEATREATVAITEAGKALSGRMFDERMQMRELLRAVGPILAENDGLVARALTEKIIEVLR